ncbi:MAG TPA: PEP-CTERM sorting domain-containing protein [Bryobacteraceae bacterium]|nr:hypothetical protein [Bryobacterales bacterium]HRJ19317.1 PEP-CTERM sorting domain-containing protein [Bryobacteraceae bacterium]
MYRLKPLRVFLLSALVLAPASAAVIGISSPASMTVTDTIDWGAIGPDNTMTASSFNIQTTGGATVTVSNLDLDIGNMFRQEQSGSWSGNFSPGDAVLFLYGEDAPLTLAFASPVAAVGANIQGNEYGPFEGTISVYGIGNNLLGSYTRTGDSNGAGDGSAIFLGMVSDGVDIYFARFSIERADYLDFGINQVLLGGEGSASAPIPEPSTWALLGAGLGWVVYRRGRA